MNAVVELPRQGKLVERMAARYGVDADKMLHTLKQTAFKGDVTNEQLMALLVVAEQHGLNPWLKEIYAFPSRQGIVPVVGVDGWLRIINEHPQFNGMDFQEADDGAWVECTIHRKDRSHPIKIREWKEECARQTDPWKSHPRRMLRHKALIQAARIAFSFAGIYDPDEAERIVEVEANTIQASLPNPRGETRAPNELVERCVSDITDLLAQDKDEFGIADDLRAYEAEKLAGFNELYIDVQDALAARDIIKKAAWRKYLKIGLDRGETHTS